MKDYIHQPNTSIRMLTSPALKSLIAEAVKEEGIEGVIETGTYDGAGSTRMLAEAFHEAGVLPKFFHTIEINLSRYRKARQNLSHFPFVECLWGRSVPADEAIQFVKNDSVLKHHEDYPDIFLDGSEDPVSFYIRECQGGVNWRKRLFRQHLNPFYHAMRLTKFKGDDLLRKLIRIHMDDKTLVVLDSAGGIGLLEFEIVTAALAKRTYWLLLDDVHHLKHFRSLERIQKDPSFKLLGSDVSAGWALTKHESSRN